MSGLEEITKENMKNGNGLNDHVKFIDMIYDSLREFLKKIRCLGSILFSYNLDDGIFKEIKKNIIKL